MSTIEEHRPEALNLLELPIVIAIRWLAQRYRHIGRLVARWQHFDRLYALVSILILLGTTFWWALQSARIHLSNADQLANAYLMQSGEVFHNALFPSAHSFLAKWPLFWAVRHTGLQSDSFVFWTIAVCIVTVTCFVLLLGWVERRAIVFGTICLALASVLMVIPAQPYPGGILPVNMAMLATRNLEYILYIISLFLIVRARQWRSWPLWSGAALLAVLAASDALFIDLALAGGILAAAAYALRRRWALMRTAGMWLAAALAAFAGSLLLMKGIEAAGITSLSAHNNLGPYGIAHDAKSWALGGVYALIGLITNFGANPSLNDSILRTVPAQLHEGLSSAGGVSFGVNALILVACTGAAIWLVWKSIMTRAAVNSTSAAKGRPQPAANTPARPSWQITNLLIWSTLACFGIFILSNHYYPVDGRYLAITLFAGFMALACFTASREWRRIHLMGLALILLVSIGSGFYAASRSNHASRQALAGTERRNLLVAQALRSHAVHVPWLVGDYWRVLPVRLQAQSGVQAMPLEACGQARGVLNSRSWQPDLSKTAFAYLLTLDDSLTNYTKCSLEQTVKQYGHPNSATLIAGTYDHPRELLLFYDKGMHRSGPLKALPTTTNPLLPLDITAAPQRLCDPGKKTIMQVMAHQDDDLLFMSPDLLYDIENGNCIRTVFITSGDAGNGKDYWLAREHGAEAAYSQMLGTKNKTWVDRTVKLGDRQFVTISRPQETPQVSLIFMHLPDGNLRGQGFLASHNESIALLENKTFSAIKTIDNQSSYSDTDLVDGLVKLMQHYSPDELRTQSSNTGLSYPDHSDHGTAGRYAKRAHDMYNQAFPVLPEMSITYYLGYRSRNLPRNVSDDDLESKTAAFMAYAAFDPSIYQDGCRDSGRCPPSLTYRAYLSRQYVSSDDR